MWLCGGGERRKAVGEGGKGGGGKTNNPPERFKGTKLFFQFVQFEIRSSYSTVMIKIPHIRNQESPEYQNFTKLKNNLN